MLLKKAPLSLALCVAVLAFPLIVHAAPVKFNLPAQPATDALLAFSQQSKSEVLFSFDQLRLVQSTAVIGQYEPENALIRLLGDSGFTARRTGKSKFVVTLSKRPTGTIKGRILRPAGGAAGNVRITVLETRQSTRLDQRGDFQIDSVPPGSYRIIATGEGYQRLQIDAVSVQAGSVRTIETQTLQKAEDLTRFDPYIVQGKAGPPRPFARSRDALPPRNAVGNIDLPRTENDALPYVIYDREQIIRSGVVGLNEFLKRAILESDGSTLSEQVGEVSQAIPSGSNLQMRGFSADETVILLDGRRLPEVLTNERPRLGSDVNYIPLSLIQQVEVLPVSASALYSGNAVGGVINIVLRPNVEATEVNATYTNAVQRFDAPQSSVSLLHGQSLLGGKLRLRLSASFTESTPPVESELGFRQRGPTTSLAPDQPFYRATPNVRSADGTPLFGPGTSSVTSVAPGADGPARLADFIPRAGLRNFELFDAPGGLAASIYSRDYAYGRQQKRTAYFGSAVYDLFPWLQLGVDATHVSTVVNRGYDLLNADLSLDRTSPFNPFGQDVQVSLNEITPALGNNYSEARLGLSSFVVGLLLKLPADWQVSFDTQYSRNVTKYRGLKQPDLERWQELVNEGLYNPLRDTQSGGTPAAFYDRALVYHGNRGQFVTLGDYDTIDAAIRVTNRKLTLPTGPSVVNFGGDYRRNHLAPYTQEFRHGDGEFAEDPVQWTGRTLQRYSGFGEMQLPVVPTHWLPGWVKKIEADFAVRYVAADTSAESNVAPTIALRTDFRGGFSLRGSATTSSRFPTPQMSRPLDSSGGTGGAGSDTIATISDSRRGGEKYEVITRELINTGLSTENSVTQTAGAIWQRGKTHRFRIAVDFVDTRKVNELVLVTNPQDILDLENYFPALVTRAPLAPGDPNNVGKVTTLLTGILNLSSRHSQNWNTSMDYAWTECLGGNLEVYSRWLYFQRYEREVVPGSPPTDELKHPDATAASLLRQRINFGASWSNPNFGFGLDGHYFSSRVLPVTQWPDQGASKIKPYWQFDAFLQGNLSQWIPWKSSRYGLRGQLRVNNISGFDYPKYSNEGSGSGIQPYGDWRGRTYSVSVTATF